MNFLFLLHQTVKEMHLKENTFFDPDLGIKVTINIAPHPLHHVTLMPRSRSKNVFSFKCISLTV